PSTSGSTPSPYTTLFRSCRDRTGYACERIHLLGPAGLLQEVEPVRLERFRELQTHRGRRSCVTIDHDVDPVAHPFPHGANTGFRSEEHTSELQSRENLVC